MLYIFQVDLGQMYTFELNLSLESVSTLKNAIAAKCDISIDNQVLLISGGDYLEDNYPVHQYNGAGTVSNPIFLFNKSFIMSPEQYSFKFQNSNDQYIDETLKQIQIKNEETLKMDESLKTLLARTDLSKKLNQLTTDLMSNCEQLIRDQHLMYQGWQAVVANLDDVANSFVVNVNCFEEQLKSFLTKRDYYIQKLKNFKSDLGVLDQIKTLPCLHVDDQFKNQVNVENDESNDKDIVKDNKNEKIDETIEDQQIKLSNDERSTAEEVTLIDLISQKDNKHCLDKVEGYCKTMLEQFNEQLLEKVKEEMNATVKTINENKKIKRIESRLYNLDMLLGDVHQHVQDQNLLTYGFIQNQNSANAYNDPTIFIDLSESHKQQLDLMFKYLNKALSIRKKFQNSKRELTLSLLARLQTIMICETELNSLNWRVLLYAESLKKLKRSLEVVDQISLAPSVYFRVFQEVNRRNIFNLFFNLWSKFIVQMNNKLIVNENEQRHKFKKIISSHFLKSFFPFLEDDVPDFATVLPAEYDQSIPLIDEQEFNQFIQNNKQFDNSLESEDNLLNGFICRINQMNSSKTMKESSITKENPIDENQKSIIDHLTNFVDSTFNYDSLIDESSIDKNLSNQKEIEHIEQKLRAEYENKIEQLKLEYKLKLDEELKKFKSINQQSNCDNLSTSLISSNISCVEQSIDQQSTNTNDQQELSSFLHSSSSNSRQIMFKNLVKELLLGIKYTDYLKSENEGPNFISFVSTIFKIKKTG